MNKLAILILTCVALAPARATIISNSAARSPAQVHAFRHTHPCPGTGRTTGACPGYVVDHIKPLCLGGADRPANMQWQTAAAGHAKDKLEWAACRKAGTMK